MLLLVGNRGMLDSEIEARLKNQGMNDIVSDLQVLSLTLFEKTPIV
jgi:hypothetical protein